MHKKTRIASHLIGGIYVYSWKAKCWAVHNDGKKGEKSESRPSCKLRALPAEVPKYGFVLRLMNKANPPDIV